MVLYSFCVLYCNLLKVRWKKFAIFGNSDIFFSCFENIKHKLFTLVKLQSGSVKETCENLQKPNVNKMTTDLYQYTAAKICRIKKKTVKSEYEVDLCIMVPKGYTVYAKENDQCHKSPHRNWFHQGPIKLLNGNKIGDGQTNKGKT